MELKQLTSEKLIALNLDAKDKLDAINQLVDMLYKEKKITSKEEFLKAVLEREKLSPTGIEAGLAIPHGKSDFVKEASFAIATLKKPLTDWESIDESNKVDLVFLLAIPSAESGSTHIELLSELMTRISNDDYKNMIKNSDSPSKLYRNLDGEVKEEEIHVEKTGKSIVAVTACPAGIAHTYMSAEALVKAGKKMGVDVYVEKQGAAGIEDRHSSKHLKEADAAIFAVAVAVKEEERFKHLPIHRVSVSEPLKDAEKVINDALDLSKKVKKGEYIEVENKEEKVSAKEVAKQSLMTGISYIIPLIVAGGMIASLALMFFGSDGVSQVGSIGNILKVFGGNIMALMIPILSGYMAYSLAEKPGLIPGIAGGIAANTVGGGFIGGIIAGYLAGYFMRWFKTIKVNKTFNGLMNMLVYPLIGTLFVGIIMLFVIGKPVGFINSFLVNMLNNLSGSNAIILSIIIGLMTCADLGGPINKAAFAFSLAAIEAGNGLPYAAFSVAKCMPGVAITLATLIIPRTFENEELELGRTSWIIGLCGITEAAIPFAMSDPIVTIPSFMIAGAVGASISYISGCSLLTAGGSIFTIPVTSNPLMWMVAILVSSIVGAICIITGRKIREKIKKA